ncbi:MAG: response regulator [Phycisphaerae bacterium]
MNDAAILHRLLVVTGPELRNSKILDFLDRQFDIVNAASIEDALKALRSGHFDAILSVAGDFLPMERAIASQQSSLILDTIGEGVCMVSPDGRVCWANRRMRQWPPEIQGRIFAQCQDALQNFIEAARPAAAGNSPAAPVLAGHCKKFAINIEDKYFFELVCSPVINGVGTITQVVAICWDATKTRRLQAKLDAIDKAGRELVRLEGDSIAKLNVMERLKLLEDKIIKFCRQLMHFDHFSIRLLDFKTNKLEPVINVGMPPEAADVELFCEPDGNGISGYVASTGRSYIAPDVARDPRYIPGLNSAQSSLTVPLMLHDKTIGIFNIESNEYAFFTEDDRQFAEIFGRYLAIALNILQLLIVERYTTSGRLVRDVAGEIAGPLNDIAMDAAALREQYIGNDEVQHLIDSIVQNVNKIRAGMSAASAGPQRIIDSASSDGFSRDPMLRDKRVLVADDQPSIRQTIQAILARCGCVVDAAADGAEACALLAGESRYDLVISDIKMPHKNGYEIFSMAQKLGHAPPVILMTGFGYDPAHSITRASQEGLSEVLCKPFKVDQLMNAIRKAIAAS